MSALIKGAGAALPATRVGNDAFAALGLDDAWIRNRSGIRTRYRLRADERLVDLAAEAGRAALADAGAAAEAVDMVIVATSTPDRISPGLAAEAAHLMGVPYAGAVDVDGACTGFLYALDYAMARIAAGRSRTALVIGADAMSRLADAGDRDTAFLFGDGAGAVSVSMVEEGSGIPPTTHFSFGSAGEGAAHLEVPRASGRLRMDGAEVYAAAVDAMSTELLVALDACGLTPDAIDLAICHQANGRIIRAVARELGLPVEKAPSYVEDYGNTSAASIPIAMERAARDGLLRPGARIALAAFGAGFTWGAGIVDWKAPAAERARKAASPARTDPIRADLIKESEPA